MRPERIYVLTHDFVMEWPKFVEEFYLRVFADDGKKYSYLNDVPDFDLSDFGSPEEFLLKAEVLGYAPCFKDFSDDALWRMSLGYEVVDQVLKGICDGQ